MQQLFVRNLDGKTLTFDVPKGGEREEQVFTVCDLKYALWKRCNDVPPPPAQRLVYCGRQMDDKEALPSNANATLHLLARMTPQIYVFLAKSNRWLNENFYADNLDDADETRRMFADLFNVACENVTCSEQWLTGFISVVTVQK